MTSPLQIVNQIVAIDPDQPLASSGVSYSLDPESNPDDVFTIENGTITAVKPVDREMVEIYKLKIKVINDTSAFDVCVSVCLSVHLCVCVSMCLCILCVSVCVSLCIVCELVFECVHVCVIKISICVTVYNIEKTCID